MKYKKKNLNNINAEKTIKDMLIALRYKKEENSSIKELMAIINYIESHKITFNYADNLKEYLNLLEKKNDMYSQEEWEWLLQYLMMITRGYLQNYHIEEWGKFDLNLLMN